MPDIQITVTPPFEKVGKALSLIKLGAALQRGITKFAFQIERFSKQQTPVDTGRLRSSISTDIGNLYARIGPHTEYAGFVHEGTRPHWAPVDALEGWAKRHGIPAFLVAKGIAAHGTKPRPFMAEGVEFAKRSMAQDEIVSEIKTEIERTLKAI